MEPESSDDDEHFQKKERRRLARDTGEEGAGGGWSRSAGRLFMRLAGLAMPRGPVAL